MEATPNQTIEEYEYAALRNLRAALEDEKKAKGLLDALISPTDPEFKAKRALRVSYAVAISALTARMNELEAEGHIRYTVSAKPSPAA